MDSLNRLPEAIEVLSQRDLLPQAPTKSESPLGPAVEVRSRASNLLSRELSLGRTLDGLDASPQLSLDSGTGWAGEGAIDLDRPADQLRRSAFGAYVVSENGADWAPLEAELRVPDNESHFADHQRQQWAGVRMRLDPAEGY